MDVRSNAAALSEYTRDHARTGQRPEMVFEILVAIALITLMVLMRLRGLSSSMSVG